MNLARGGQVYYVYNRVNNIDEITNHVAGFVPEANVTFAHGQMHEHELERIMLDFVNGDIDACVHDYYRNRPRYTECQYDYHT